MQRIASLLSGSDSVALALDSWGSSRGGERVVKGSDAPEICCAACQPHPCSEPLPVILWPSTEYHQRRFVFDSSIEGSCRSGLRRHRSGVSVGPPLRLHTMALGGRRTAGGPLPADGHMAIAPPFCGLFFESRGHLITF